jgi:hypothetical protein
MWNTAVQKEIEGGEKGMGKESRYRKQGKGNRQEKVGNQRRKRERKEGRRYSKESGAGAWLKCQSTCLVNSIPVS